MYSFRHIFAFCLTLCLAVAFAPVLQAADNKPLKVKVGTTSFPPFYVVNPDQTASGIYLDIIEKTLQHAGLDYQLDIYPTKRLYRNLGNGETELFLGIKGSPEYDKNVLYSSTAISQIQMRIYAVGDINHYPGKRKLILSGFHEAALAAFSIAEKLSDQERLPTLYTTTSPIVHKRMGVAVELLSLMD